MRIERLAGFGDLDEKSWNGLLERSRMASVFLTWQWQTAWVEAFGAGRPLHLLAATADDGTLAGLLPLHEERPGCLRLIGGVDVSDYLDAIAVTGLEEEVWRALLASRAGDAPEWDLHCLRAASPTVGMAPALAVARGLRADVAVEERCPVLPLPDSWEAYLARLDGRDRHEIKRKIRRLERELPGAVARAHAAAEGWDEALAVFLRLHRQSKVGKARFMDERMERFFRVATRALAEAGWARLWFLEHPGGPVATFLCVEYGAAVGLYNSGFDPAHARLAPGLVLLAHVIQDSIARRVPVFDFLRGEEPYKADFGPVPEDLYRVSIAQ
jgi:CelD/BcsL family acetyltransferase involved in cellulose biosynthesis